MNNRLIRLRNQYIARVLDRLDSREPLDYARAGARRGLEMCSSMTEASDFARTIQDRQSWEATHNPTAIDKAEEFRAFFEHKAATRYIEIIFTRLKTECPEWASTTEVPAP